MCVCERERDFYSQESGIQKGHAHQTWCLVRANDLSKVAVDSAAAGIEPAISSRKSNAVSTAPSSHESSS